MDWNIIIIIRKRPESSAAMPLFIIWCNVGYERLAATELGAENFSSTEQTNQQLLSVILYSCLYISQVSKLY